MQVSDFTKDMPGGFAPTIGGQMAFVPDDLPPKLRWNGTLASTVSAADRALGQLAGIGQDIANPRLLIRPFIRREAVLSSQIEGTEASDADLLLFEVNEKVERDIPDVREVANYVRALEYGLQQNSLPLSLRLIRQLHAVLMAGVRGERSSPGEFRTTQVHIGPAGAGIEEAIFVPPPPSHLKQTLDAFETFLHAPSDLPPVVRMALMHYQFEAIHPFVDGNGRIGRLLISLMLSLDGILPMPLLYLSAYFHETREQYYRQLLQVSRRGTWVEWIIYFARGVARQAQDAVQRVQRLKQLQADYMDRVRTARAPALLTKLIEELFERPMVTIAGVAKALGITYVSAQGHVRRLIDAGILRQLGRQKRNRIFVADGIVEAISDTTIDGSRSSR